MTTSLATTPKTSNWVMGDGNVHVHTCPEGHTWECDSCYCNAMRIKCPEHGGPEPKLNSSR